MGKKPRTAGLCAGDGPDLAESFVIGAILRKLKRLLSIVVKRVGGGSEKVKKGMKKMRRRDLIIWVTLGAVGGALIYGLLGRGWLEVAGLVAGYLIGLFIVLILWECFRRRGITFPKFLEKFRAKRLPATLKEKIYLSVGGLVVCGAAVGIAYAWIEFLKGVGAPWPVLLLLGLPVFFGVFMLGAIVLNKIFGLTDFVAKVPYVAKVAPLLQKSDFCS